MSYIVKVNTRPLTRLAEENPTVFSKKVDALAYAYKVSSNFSDSQIVDEFSIEVIYSVEQTIHNIIFPEKISLDDLKLAASIVGEFNDILSIHNKHILFNKSKELFSISSTNVSDSHRVLEISKKY